MQEILCPMYKEKDFDLEQHGQYHMTPQEQLENRKTVYIEMLIGVENTTEELIRNISIFKNVRIEGLKHKLQDAARKYEVHMTHNVPRLLIKFWKGKPKGLLQVLWEHGFIDPSKPIGNKTITTISEPTLDFLTLR